MAGVKPADVLSHAERFLRRQLGRLENLSEQKRKQLMRGMIASAALIFVAAFSVITVKALAPKAAVTVDGKSLTPVEINSEETAVVLKSAGVTLGKDDEVTVTPSGSGEQIVVRTAKTVSVSADGGTKTVLMHWGDSVGAAIAEAGLTLGADDRVSADVASSVRDGMTVSVTRCYTVSITADGAAVQAKVWEGSVKSALSQTNTTVGEEDIVTPAADSALSEGLAIRVQRVTYRDVTTTEAIPYESSTVNDQTKEKGTKTVVTAGQNGEKKIVTREKLIDGAVASGTVVSSTVTAEPVTEVIAVGTMSPYATVSADGTLIDQAGNVLSYSKVLTGRCTTYCYGTYGASGLPLGRGTCAVNPNLIPYGSKLYICSPDGTLVYGYAVAADTGTAAMEGNIVADLFYDTLDECCWFGARTMSVYVLS